MVVETLPQAPKGSGDCGRPERAPTGTVGAGTVEGAVPKGVSRRTLCDPLPRGQCYTTVRGDEREGFSGMGNRGVKTVILLYSQPTTSGLTRRAETVRTCRWWSILRPSGTAHAGENQHVPRLTPGETRNFSNHLLIRENVWIVLGLTGRVTRSVAARIPVPRRGRRRREATSYWKSSVQTIRYGRFRFATGRASGRGHRRLIRRKIKKCSDGRSGISDLGPLR